MDDPRVETLQMFGGVAAKVNGHLFAGLFGRSVLVRLSDADSEEALALEGAAPFDPMGTGRTTSDKVMLPEALMDEPIELRRWLARAFDATALLPPKKQRKPQKKQAQAKKTQRPARALAEHRSAPRAAPGRPGKSRRLKGDSPP